MRSLYFFCSLLIFVESNSKLLEIEKNPLSAQMREFMRFIVETNYRNKDGFCLILINKVHAEFSNYASLLLTKNSSTSVINFDIDKTTAPIINPNHFKFVLVDPEGEVDHAQASFRKVRISRARIVLILTKKPNFLFVRYLLNSYRKINALNVILAYENNDQPIIEVLSFNPFVESSEMIQNLTSTKYSRDLFEDKTKNLHGREIKALLTYPDRTKVKFDKKKKRYAGKDFVTINTIVKHLNGKLIIENMNNILFNPWYESLDISNRNELKKRIMKKRDISLFVKSDTFSIDDEIVDNLYPHTQNDLIALVQKSSSISLTQKMLKMFTPKAYFLASIIQLGFFLGVLLIKKKYQTNSVKILDLLFIIWRIISVQNITIIPRCQFERILQMEFLFYCFLINLFVVSKITSFLTVTNYYTEIDTIDQMMAAGLPLYAIPNHIEELKKKYAGTEYENYITSFLPLATNEGLLDHIMFSDQNEFYPYLTEHDIGVFVSRFKNFRKDGAPIYHLVKESLIPNYQSYKVPHTSPLLNIFNKKLRRLGEGGFIELWAKRAIENATIEGNLYLENNDETINLTKAISLEVIQFSFHLLIFGFICSIIVFFLEVFLECICDKPNRFQSLKLKFCKVK